MWRISFTNPWALWLATAAVAPLIIHLLSRHRLREVRFPAVRFIRLSQRKSRRRTHLKNLLLLLLRMALIALFALLIARPAVRGGGAAEPAGAIGTPAAVLVLDDSLSMSYRRGDTTWFDVARSRALDLANRLPKGVAAAVLPTSRPSGKLTRDAAALAGRIAALRAGTGGNSCWQALASAADLLKQEGAARRDVFVFTDMTPSAWSGIETRTVEMGDQVAVHVIDCAPSPAPNGAVYELRQSGEPAIVGAALTVEARVLASGGPVNRAVQFEFDGRPLVRRELSLAAGEETWLSFRTVLAESGHHWGRVAFPEPDPLPQDDTRAFTLDVAPEVSVLCVEDSPEQTVTSLSYFFRLALNPWQEPGRGIFRVDRASPAQLASRPLGPYDVVVLVAAGGMTDAAWERLDAYVSSGGGLLAFLGPETGDSYRTPAAQAVLPVEVGRALVATPESPFGLRIVKSGHPFVSALAESGATLAQVRYRECRQVVPQPDAVELLSFGPDLPALVLSEVGGKAATFAGTADERWGDFAKTEPYTPFCHELLLYLSGRTAGGLRSVPVGSQVSIPFEASPWPTLVHVTPPGASEAERLLPGTTPDRYSWWKTDVPGYYRVDFERKDKRWRGGFAVNTAPIESRMEKVPFDKVQRAVHAGKVELVGDGSPGGAAGAQAVGLGELTPYLALLALLLLVAEGFLANRFYGVPKAPPPEGGDEGGQAAGGG